MISYTPKLVRLSEGPLERDRIVVLIHGIFSSHEQCFPHLISNLQRLGAEEDFEIWAFDYDYMRSITESGDALATAMMHQPFIGKSVDLLGHSMGGLVARLAVIRNTLPFVRRLITLATPNHGAVNGVQLNFYSGMVMAAARRFHPLYARAPGLLDLNAAHTIMRDQIGENVGRTPDRLRGKSYVSIPAQYYHHKRQIGDPPPSLLMGGVTTSFRLLNWIAKQQLIKMQPVHDGIVEETSNRLSPPPVGSTSEGSYMPTRQDERDRILHVTHEEAAQHDHITVTGSCEIAELILALLKADGLEPSEIDPHLSGARNRVRYNPSVD